MEGDVLFGLDLETLLKVTQCHCDCVCVCVCVCVKKIRFRSFSRHPSRPETLPRRSSQSCRITRNCLVPFSARYMPKAASMTVRRRIHAYIRSARHMPKAASMAVRRRLHAYIRSARHMPKAASMAVRGFSFLTEYW